MNQGLALRFPISYGTASILVSVAVIVVDLLMKEPIGLGTILDAFLVGWGTDLFLSREMVTEKAGRKKEQERS